MFQKFYTAACANSCELMLTEPLVNFGALAFKACKGALEFSKNSHHLLGKIVIIEYFREKIRAKRFELTLTLPTTMSVKS